MGVIIDCTCCYCISAISWLCGYDSWVKQSRPHGWRQNGITVWFVLIILRIGRVVISVVEYQTIFAIPTRKNGSDIVPMVHLRVIMGSLKGQIVLPVVSSKTTLLKISKISQFISPVFSLHVFSFSQGGLRCGGWREAAAVGTMRSWRRSRWQCNHYRPRLCSRHRHHHRLHYRNQHRRHHIYHTIDNDTCLEANGRAWNVHNDQPH